MVVLPALRALQQLALQGNELTDGITMHAGPSLDMGLPGASGQGLPAQEGTFGSLPTQAGQGMYTQGQSAMSHDHHVPGQALPEADMSLPGPSAPAFDRSPDYKRARSGTHPSGTPPRAGVAGSSHLGTSVAANDSQAARHVKVSQTNLAQDQSDAAANELHGPPVAVLPQQSHGPAPHCTLALDNSQEGIAKRLPQTLTQTERA